MVREVTTAKQIFDKLEIIWKFDSGRKQSLKPINTP